MLRVERYKGLGDLPQPYSHVFDQAGSQSFFLSLPWFQHFEKTIVGQDETVLIYGVEEGLNGHPVAALPLRAHYKNRGLFCPRTIQGLSNYYSSYFGPAVAFDHRVAEISRAFASALWQDRQHWDVINLRPLDPQSLVFTSLVQSFREIGMAVQTYFCFGNWYFGVAGRSYSQYFQSLPKVLRKNIPYEARKLERAARVQFEILTAEGLEKALDDYEKVYNASWREPEPYPAFIRGLARTAMECGWLRLGLLYLDGEPAAAQLWIVHAGMASIYKICYQERFAHLSVGKILTARMMQHVIDVDKVEEVDYLSGDDAYKKDWMSHRRERWGIIAFNSRNAKGLTQAIRHIGGRSIKRTFTRIFPGNVQN